VTAQSYTQELATLQKERPDVRIIVFDHEITPGSALFRFNME